jgi:hypothetical protein
MYLSGELKVEKHSLMKKRHILGLLLVLTLPLLAGCERDSEFTPPSFLHVEAINLVPPAQNAITQEDGFYTSDIVGAVVYVRRKESQHLDTLGHFRLPLTVPILYSGEVDYIDIYPAVKQSGSASILPTYPFYNRIRLNDTAVTSGDTLWLDTLTTTYNITRSDVLMYELFEPTEGSLLFDSVMQWRPHAPAEARSGQGYGYVPVNDSTYTLDFTIDRDLSVVNPQTHRVDPTRNVYLELDARSDVDFEVLLEGAYNAGTSPVRVNVMTVYKSDEWVHLYINLWRTWKELNFCSSFRISFTAINEKLVNGEVRLDNVKVLTCN